MTLCSLSPVGSWPGTEDCLAPAHCVSHSFTGFISNKSCDFLCVVVFKTAPSVKTTLGFLLPKSGKLDTEGATCQHHVGSLYLLIQQAVVFIFFCLFVCFYYFYFIYFLAALGLGCSTWDLCCGLWDPPLQRACSSLRHTDFSLVVACWLQSAWVL